MPIKPIKLNADQNMLLDTAARCFTYWEQLDNMLRNDLHSRGANFPSVLSEMIASCALNLTRELSNSGDAKDSKGNIIEIKATSAKDTDLSSFSPTEEFSNLVFCKYVRKDRCIEIYNLKLSRKDIEKIEVKKGETFEEQATAGRRPRFSIERKIIKPNGLTPDFIAEIETKNRQTKITILK
ncbi:Bsp6I family type II restriction endonuclease [Aminicella lysinilytica]|uniref:Bsp6I restriction endonuclease n=1 Tax=Aminicella lysinilytica TaxID=433323 RepID=A0A4R6PXK4_9FIRM|nr:Bsp6I family type II restriction endonuclease [Aminicella lysinilytica]TDP46463.1 Bsp6I restriction endonuclease [Aminicella lysinilytica]